MTGRGLRVTDGRGPRRAGGQDVTQEFRIAQRRVVMRDPHDCTDAADELTVYHALFDTLVKRVGQGFVPHLAEGWTVGPDARTWSFRLRPGVTFHDGTPCDAAAVVGSLARMARPDKGYALGAPGVWNQYLGRAELAAPDARTVVIGLPEPLADLLDILEGLYLSPSQLRSGLDRGADGPPVGRGVLAGQPRCGADRWPNEVEGLSDEQAAGRACGVARRAEAPSGWRSFWTDACTWPNDLIRRRRYAEASDIPSASNALLPVASSTC